MDVRPGEYEDVEITCTITNTHQLPEEISFQIDEDNSTGDFSYDISPEGPYQLAAGEEQVVVVSVRGSQGMEADTSTYTVQMTPLSIALELDSCRSSWCIRQHCYRIFRC